MKRAIILDLDNTIYPVSSIAHHLFDKLFKLIDEDLGKHNRQAATKAKEQLTRRPYQHVADEYGFSDDLKNKGLQMLSSCTIDIPMQPYDAYADLRTLTIDKYLVTTGFTKLQMSKVKMLAIAGDFKKVYVVDPELSNQTKKDVFTGIMQNNGYTQADVLVIGDDPQSEIKAAIELGIDTFLFDPDGRYPDAEVTFRGKDYKGVEGIVR